MVLCSHATDFMQLEDFPESLKAEFRQQKEKEDAERRQREIDKSTCKVSQSGHQLHELECGAYKLNHL